MSTKMLIQFWNICLSVKGFALYVALSVSISNYPILNKYENKILRVILLLNYYLSFKFFY